MSSQLTQANELYSRGSVGMNEPLDRVGWHNTFSEEESLGEAGTNGKGVYSSHTTHASLGLYSSAGMLGKQSMLI